MEGRRARSRKKPDKLRRQRKRRFGGLAAVMLIASMILEIPFSWNTLVSGPSRAFASAGRQKESLWATASNAKYKKGKTQDVDIYVIAEDNDTAPGNLSVMTIYLKNNTDQLITEGSLTFSSRYISQENGAFVDYYAAEDEETKAEAAAEEENEKEEDEEFAEDEENPAELKEISLEPGEWREIYFEFYTEEDLGPTKAFVNFRFAGEGEEGKIRSSQKFYYSIGLPAVNLELSGGDGVETGVFQEMNIWMSEPSWSDWREEEELASDSEAVEEETASPSQAEKTASPSDVDKEENSQKAKREEKDRRTIEKYEEKAMEIAEAKVQYQVEIFGTEFRKFRPRKAEEAEDIGWINCVYQLAQDARPGIYYGKVKAVGRWNNEKFTAEQGFLFEVTGEGRITLEEQKDGMEIQITGPASSFPEAEELELEVGDITQEEQELLDGLILEEGQSLSALHFRLLADGEEKPLIGPATVRLSGKVIEEWINAYPELIADSQSLAEHKEEGPEVVIEEPLAGTEEGAEASAVILPEMVIRQGPGAAAAYLAGEEITASRRIAEDGTLIIRRTGDDFWEDENEEALQEEIIADGSQAGIHLLAVDLDYGQLEELEWGITNQNRLQTETEQLPAAYVITSGPVEESGLLKGSNLLTYEDEEVRITVTLPESCAAALWDGADPDHEPKLQAEILASPSTAGSVGEGFQSDWGKLMNAAEKRLSDPIAEMVFCRLGIAGRTAEETVYESMKEPFKVEIQFKNRRQKEAGAEEIEVLQYTDESARPKLLSAHAENADEWGESVTYEVNSLEELTGSTFGFAWTATFNGVNTGGPGTDLLSVGGMGMMLLASWLWQREIRQRKKGEKSS